MATDTIILGPVEFDAWSAPERLPFGGRQQTNVKRLPGGARVVDCMGPDDIDRIWTGKFWGDDALANALTLDALRKSGTPLPFVNGVEARTVIISEFVPLVVKMPHYVEFSITLLTTDLGGGGGGFGIAIPTLDVTVAADLAAAVGLL